MKGSLNAGPGAGASETAAFAAARSALTSGAWGEGEVAAHLLTRRQDPSGSSLQKRQGRGGKGWGIGGCQGPEHNPFQRGFWKPPFFRNARPAFPPPPNRGKY